MNQMQSSCDVGTAQKSWVRRTRIVALLWLFALLITCVAGPVAYCFVKYQLLISSHRSEGEELVAEFPFSINSGLGYNVLVFVPMFQGWPGQNPQTVVVTDKFFNQLSSSKLADGDSMFRSAVVEYLDGAPYLRITRVYRPMWGGIGSRRYALVPSGASPSGDILWDDLTFWPREFKRLGLLDPDEDGGE